jgi:hypothetical protein
MRYRSVQLNIRLTEEEHKKLLRSMEKSKLSASTYVRSLITGHSPKECPPLEFHELISQLQSVSTQLKTIFHLICIMKKLDESDIGLLEKEMAKYQQILLTIQAAVLLPDDVGKLIS